MYRNRHRRQILSPSNKDETNIKNLTKKDILKKTKEQQPQQPLNTVNQALSDVIKDQFNEEINKNKNKNNTVNKDDKKVENHVENQNIPNKLIKEKNAKLKLYDNSKEERHSMLVEWNIEKLDKYDRIAIYQHQRFHDTHYLQIFNVKENTGKYVFKNLVDGFYDVRLLNWNTRYQNIPIVECCLGQRVNIKAEIPKNIYPPVLKVYIPNKLITSKNDYVAVYNKSEHSNEFSKSLMVRYMDKAKYINDNDINENGIKFVQFELKNMIGDYIIKYFHYNSTSMLHGNVYSGICNISVKNYNNLEVKVDRKNKSIRVNWRIYTIEPNNSQWIGICDEKNKLKHYEYVCYHKYDNESKMQGTVLIENNKFTEEFFDNKIDNNKDEKKEEMEKSIEEEKIDENAEKTWKVKFYNKGMIMNYKVMEIPLNK